MTLSKRLRSDFWNLSPLRRVTSLRDEVDNLFSLAFGHLANATAENARRSQLPESWFPPVDVSEDKDNLVVKAELPGLKKEDIEISLHEGFLTLSGERKEGVKNEDVGVYRSERWTGRFHRTISLPFEVVADKIAATYNEGVLQVTLPKAEEAKPKQIQITVK